MAVALTLAQRAGIDVAPFTVTSADGRRAVLLTERFDRGVDSSRVPYISAFTAMGLGTHKTGDNLTYADFADTVAELLDAADAFEMTGAEAAATVAGVSEVVETWPGVAAGFGITASEIRAMREAFSESQIEAALSCSDKTPTVTPSAPLRKRTKPRWCGARPTLGSARRSGATGAVDRAGRLESFPPPTPHARSAIPIRARTTDSMIWTRL